MLLYCTHSFSQIVNNDFVFCLYIHTCIEESLYFFIVYNSHNEKTSL